MRKNIHAQTIFYLIPENEEEQVILKKAWEKGRLLFEVGLISNSGELGVYLKEIETKEGKRV